MKNENKNEKTIELSLATKNYDGNQNVWFESHEVQYGNLEKTCKENNFSPIKWTGGHRRNADFLYATGFVIDIDEGLQIQDAIERLKKLGLKYLILPSKSHTSQKHKYHILLIFNRPVRSVNAYQRIAKHIASEVFPECDSAVTDPARYIYGSPDHVSVSSDFSGNDFIVDEFGPFWDNSLSLRSADGEEVGILDVTEKTVIHCPFHEDQTPSAFLEYSKSSNNYYIYCSTCDYTFWMEKSVSRLEALCKPYWSYGTDIFELGIVGEEFFIEKIGRTKFHILTGTESNEDKTRAYTYLVKRKHIPHITRIDFLGDINADESYYVVKPKEGIIEVHYAALPIVIKDNHFIEAYLEDRFGKYKSFIKQWWAVFCYTNHLRLPTLVLKGPRGNGKSTFAEITGEFFQPLTFMWRGHEESFTYEVEKKLLIVEENEDTKPHQYKTLKKYAGQKYAVVNKKFRDPYKVQNNTNIILLANDAIPLFVSRDEKPTDERNNQFFIYEFPEITGTLDPQIHDRITQRLGHYIRTELKTVCEFLNTSGYRYSITVPITGEEKTLFQDSVTDLESDADKYLQKLMLYYTDDRTDGAYYEFINEGFVPTQFFKDFEMSPKHCNRVIKNLKKRGYLKGEPVRMQHDNEKHYCYRITKKLRSEMEAAEFEEIGKNVNSGHGSACEYSL